MSHDHRGRAPSCANSARLGEMSIPGKEAQCLDAGAHPSNNPRSSRSCGAPRRRYLLPKVPPETPTPNQYVARVRTHYERWLPMRLGQIPPEEREGFYSMLGEQIADRVQALEMALRGPDPEGEDFMTRLGRFNMARLQAEEAALAEALPSPEEDAAEENLITSGSFTSEWIPLVEDPTHPWWIAERARLEDDDLRRAEAEAWDREHPPRT